MYRGPLSQAVGRVKLLSISSCAATVIGAPVIVAMGDASTAAAKVGIAGTLLTFGVFTTAMLHLYTKPYIHKLWVANMPKDSAKESWDAIELTAERMSLFAQRYTETFTVGDTKPYEGWHPLGTFAKTKDGLPMYLDKDNFPDQDLYAYVAGADVEEAEGDGDQGALEEAAPPTKEESRTT